MFSKHGPTECLGNVQELCFRSVYPNSQDWFSFITCLNQNYQRIGSDGYAERCARKLKKDYTPVEECVHSGDGAALLKASILQTQSKGISTSCTIFIDNKLRCVHDQDWKDCDGGHEIDDFVRDIENAY
ncbi:hypothetical protein BC937DRAFT_90117 [Endogone sp. FLAS-F59071]|nr:hypothetical protein BC937DRAFT_90117 [Endogone sp. FLAS-F59071]|eukprot:RUS17327.1 hypothetical protein BC937DRAFT_90117 [Endogone sp. FLAS-F59071]